MKDCFSDHEFRRRLHNELLMPVDVFGAVAGAALMSLSLLFVTPPLLETQRPHAVAVGSNINGHLGSKPRRTGARVREGSFGISSADALRGGRALGRGHHDDRQL
jgi:hypothetical protein